MHFSLKQFSISGTEMGAEASSLRIKPGQVPASRVFPDAMDMGIKVESHATGKVETFLLDFDLTNEHCWHFKPHNKNCKIQDVYIFND